jgi:hypothetical protein
MCACPQHRGGTAPGEEGLEVDGHVFAAKFPGVGAENRVTCFGQRLLHQRTSQ